MGDDDVHEDPWRAADARRAEHGGGGLTSPRAEHRDVDDVPTTATSGAPGPGVAPPPDPSWPAPERGPADWFDPRPVAPPPGPLATPADGHPGLGRPGAAPTWVPPTGEPTPGMAAPGRHGWGRSTGTYTPTVVDKGATLSLILAAVALVVCGILLGPAAIAEGVKARRRIAASGGGLTGDGRAIAGICLGAAATLLAALGLVITYLAATGP